MVEALAHGLEVRGRGVSVTETRICVERPQRLEKLTVAHHVAEHVKHPGALPVDVKVVGFSGVFVAWLVDGPAGINPK